MSKRAEEAALKAYPQGADEFHMCVGIETLRWVERRCGYQEGYDQAEKEIIQRIRDELERRLDLYGCLSKETVHPVRLDEEKSMLRFLDELEKE